MTKRCSKCLVVKTVDEFNRQTRSKDGLHAWCKVCKQASDRERRQQDAEHISARRRRRYAEKKQGIPSPAARLPAMGTPEWEQRHRWSRCLTAAKQQAKKFGATVIDLTLDEWVEVVAEHGATCHYCGASGELWIEHMQPLFHGGGHTRSNVVPSCPGCNRRKSKSSAENFKANRCRRGHDLTDNVYVFPDGKKRICKTCRRESFRRYREKKRREAAAA